jgi:hypothetical protein
MILALLLLESFEYVVNLVVVKPFHQLKLKLWRLKWIL